VLVNVTGGPDMTLLEVDEACNAISEQVDPDANTIFGAAYDPSLQGKIRVSVVATGMEGALNVIMEPRPVRAVPAPRPMAAAPMAAMDDEMMDAGDDAEPMPVMMDDEADEPMTAAPMMTAEPPMPGSMPAEPMMLDAEMDEAEADEEMFAEELSLDLPEPVRMDAPEARPVTRIVDPMVEDDEPPLFAGTTREPAPQKSGRFFSLFGGRRSYEPDATPTAQRAPAPAAQARQPEPATQAEIEAAEDEDDLEIPSFLRRLAN
jgi:cell division protein FtsZ